jgi:hypothetical protein
MGMGICGKTIEIRNNLSFKPIAVHAFVTLTPTMILAMELV